MDHYSADLQKLQDEHGVNVHRTRRDPDAQLEAWDKLIEELEQDRS
jgi:putative heme degradation protein